MAVCLNQTKAILHLRYGYLYQYQRYWLQQDTGVYLVKWIYNDNKAIITMCTQRNVVWTLLPYALATPLATYALDVLWV